jgi:hypothetical protein
MAGRSEVAKCHCRHASGVRLKHCGNEGGAAKMATAAGVGPEATTNAARYQAQSGGIRSSISARALWVKNPAPEEEDGETALTRWYRKGSQVEFASPDRARRELGLVSRVTVDQPSYDFEGSSPSCPASLRARARRLPRRGPESAFTRVFGAL